MQLENSFSVPLPVDEAWRVLLDIERIAPCMPGAALDSVSGDDFTGRVKVKLGPINLTYQGKASFVEKDEAAHRAVIDARGKDQRGNGTAAAVITATLVPEGAVTRVDVVTDLNITGRPAQFGRGVMTDVGNKLLGQFADKLAAQLGEGDARATPTARRPRLGAAAATATGVVEEVAASVEQVPGDSAAATTVKKAAAATKKAAAGATERVSAPRRRRRARKKAEPAKKAAGGQGCARQEGRPREEGRPAAKAAPAKKAAPGRPTGRGSPAATRRRRRPATARPRARAARPSGPTAPPARPATGAPVRSSRRPGPARLAAPPVAEPEPIDLLEVAGAQR